MSCYKRMQAEIDALRTELEDALLVIEAIDEVVEEAGAMVPAARLRLTLSGAPIHAHCGLDRD
jgi:chemotaxis regulatin CheY-phosphate phosphatase CheZ